MTKLANLFISLYSICWFKLTNSTCPASWLESSTGQCYLYVPTANISWTDATTYCKNYGANLPVFRNLSDQFAYSDLMRSINVTDGTLQFLGIHQVNNTWLWVDNSPLTFPFNSSGNGVCSLMQITPSPEYIWNDLPCKKENYTFCCMMPNITTSATTTTAPVITSITTTKISTTLLTTATTTTTKATTTPTPTATTPTSTKTTTTTKATTTKPSSTPSSTTTKTSITLPTTTKTTTNPTTTSTTKKEAKTFSSTTASASKSNATVTTPAEIASDLTTLFTQMNISTAFLADPMSLAAGLQDIGPFFMSSLNDSIKQQMGQQKSDLIRVCTYERNDCLSDENFQYLYNPTFGNCYTFNSGASPKYYVKNIGPDNGLRILLQASQDDYSCTTQISGFRINFHQNNLPCYPNSEGFNVPPGSVSTIVIEQTRTTRLGKPYETCANTNFLNINGSYTVEDCLNKCFQNFCVEQCKCADPRLPTTVPGTQFCGLDSKNCLDYINNCIFESVMAKCSCPPPCSELEFFSITTSVKINSIDVYKKSFCQSSSNASHCEDSFSENFAILYVYYRSLNIITYDQVATYTLTNVLNDFSGVTGLLLGVAVITIPEILCFFFAAITICCIKHNKSRHHIWKKK